jgi:hypothetical protein
MAAMIPMVTASNLNFTSFECFEAGTHVLWTNYYKNLDSINYSDKKNYYYCSKIIHLRSYCCIDCIISSLSVLVSVIVQLAYRHQSNQYTS